MASEGNPANRNREPAIEPASGRPVASGEQWLGRDAHAGRRLWERLSPPHRRLLRLLAQALVLRQEKARLPQAACTKLLTALDELDRLATRVERLLAAVASRTRPAD